MTHKELMEKMGAEPNRVVEDRRGKAFMSEEDIKSMKRISLKELAMSLLAEERKKDKQEPSIDSEIPKDVYGKHPADVKDQIPAQKGVAKPKTIAVPKDSTNKVLNLSKEKTKDDLVNLVPPEVKRAEKTEKPTIKGEKDFDSDKLTGVNDKELEDMFDKKHLVKLKEIMKIREDAAAQRALRSYERGEDSDDEKYPEPGSAEMEKHFKPLQNEEDSQAGEEARKKGLRHVGNGRYADQSGKVTHQSDNGRLVPVQADPSKSDAQADTVNKASTAPAFNPIPKKEPTGRDMDLFPQEQWWKNDPESLIRHIYWLHGQMPPMHTSKRNNQYQSIVTQLQNKHPAPYAELKKHRAYKFEEYDPNKTVIRPAPAAKSKDEDPNNQTQIMNFPAEDNSSNKMQSDAAAERMRARTRGRYPTKDKKNEFFKPERGYGVMDDEKSDKWPSKMESQLSSNLPPSLKEKAKLGSGARFKAVAKKAAASGARNPDAVAAVAGRKKYGKKKMAKLAAAGKKK